MDEAAICVPFFSQVGMKGLCIRNENLIAIWSRKNNRPMTDRVALSKNLETTLQNMAERPLAARLCSSV
jgi:hypothetical protein